MRNTITTTSCLIILLGAVHLSFALQGQMDEQLLWFIGTGAAIIFAGLLNLVAVGNGSSRFAYTVAVGVNLTMVGLFSISLSILNQPQVYVAIAIFLITTISFVRGLHQMSKKVTHEND